MISPLSNEGYTNPLHTSMLVTNQNKQIDIIRPNIRNENIMKVGKDERCTQLSHSKVGKRETTIWLHNCSPIHTRDERKTYVET